MGEKVGNEISRSCTTGKVVSFELNRDRIPRIAEVEYQNLGESCTQTKIDDRAARSSVKLFFARNSDKKQLEEFSEYNYVFPGWWEFLLLQLRLSHPDGSPGSQLQVPRDRARSRSSKPTYNSGGSSH